MNIRGFGKNIIVMGLAAAVLTCGAGCNQKLYSDPEKTSVVETTVDPMSFEAIDAKIRDYNFGINEYMKEHLSESTQKKTSGTTFKGYPAECTYTISPDGKYESLQMEKTIDNGVQMDEYFNMGDSVFVARTTIYNDGNFEPVEKFYIINGALYKIDGSAGTVTKIVDLGDASAQDVKNTNDLYFSFDEIRAVYA